LPLPFRPSKYPEFDITSLKVKTDSHRIVGKTLSELDVRNRFGINILGLSRKDELLTNTGPDEVILQRDILYVTGSQEGIDAFRKAIE
jgi:CPA2 family monovalent cation:H+ antiporter-2